MSYHGNHFYGDVSNLNAPYHMSAVQGLGADASYPWHVYSAATQSVQRDMNEFLPNMGKCPVETDGKLGAYTCGAWRAIHQAGHTATPPPGTCQSFSDVGSPPGCVAQTTPQAPSTGPIESEIEPVTERKASAGATWVPFLLAGGAVLVAGFLMTKKGRRR